MIALDSNILARFYVDDPSDPEATQQRPIANAVISQNPSLFVPLTVLLELEWVLRAFYRFQSEDVTKVIAHLLGLPNVNLEESARIAAALDPYRRGLDFADALHLSASTHCEALYSFDDRKFARPAQRLGAMPEVVVPTGSAD